MTTTASRSAIRRLHPLALTKVKRLAMVTHVLVIYRANVAGDRVIDRARAIVLEHRARLTVGVMTGRPGPPGESPSRDARWDAVMLEDTVRVFERARTALGPTTAHLTEIGGRGPRAIAAVANGLGCDMILIPAGRWRRGHRLAGAVRPHTAATVIAVGPR